MNLSEKAAIPAVAGPLQVKAALAAYFAIIGVLSPYLGLYLEYLELNAGQIALLLALPQATRIVAPPIWGWLADYSRNPALILKLSSGVMVLSMLALLAVKASPFGIAMALLSFYIFSAAQIPLVETFTLSVANGNSGAYGAMRVWGSIGFISMVMLFGFLLDLFGKMSVPWGLVVLSIGLFAICNSFNPLPRGSPSVLAPATPLLPSFLKAPVLWHFASCTLMVFAHSGLYSFYSLFLANEGYSSTAIGALWAVGVLAEMIWFNYQQRYFTRYSARAIIIFCTLVAALRFTAIGALAGWGTGWLAALAMLLLQTTHAFTFAAHHSAVMSLMHKWFSAAQQSRAQATFVALVYGIGGAAGALVAGQLWQHVSPAAVFYGAAVAASISVVFAFLAKR